MKRSFAPSFVAAVVMLVLLPPAAAHAQVEITGQVRDVDGTRVTIPVSDGPLPRVGDPVSLMQEVPGVGAVPVDGEWIVTDVALDLVVANAWGEAAKPQPGQIWITTGQGLVRMKFNESDFVE